MSLTVEIINIIICSNGYWFNNVTTESSTKAFTEAFGDCPLQLEYTYLQYKSLHLFLSKTLFDICQWTETKHIDTVACYSQIQLFLQ
jgi:hypothetical protein